MIGEWINFYNQKRKHSALQYKTPAEVFRLVA
ncbi:integrase core domain-containing protein [Nitratiruptor tergarcus]